MSRTLNAVIWTLVIALMLLCFIALFPSLLGLVMAALLIFAIADHASRRRLNAVKSFNSTIRAVCHRDGAITKAAVAFSRSGPLSGRCYEYARRLMMGQDPIEAASRARIPLQLSTAVALQSPTASEQIESTDQEASYDFVPVESGWMPAYGQFMYLVITAAVSCAVLSFIGVFVVPILDKIFEEFFFMDMPHRWLLSPMPAFWVLLLLGVIVVFIAPILGRGYLFGFSLPRWLPLAPGLAEHKSEVLYGLADAIDAGWPMGRALAVGHTISIDRQERRSLERAMELIEQGRTPADAIYRTRWIDRGDAAWLEGASPERTAELLRTIGDQSVRDARSNLRWVMNILFPTIVVLLATAVLAYAYGFFGTLFQLTHFEGPS